MQDVIYQSKRLIFCILLVTLMMVPGVQNFAAPATPAAAEAPTQGAAVATANGVTNVMAGPSNSFWIVGVLDYLETVPVLGLSPDGGWWFIRGDFGTGWVPVTSVSASGTANVAVYQPGTIVTITGSVLNVRGGPGTGAQQLGRVSAGQHVYLIGRSTDGSWLNIEWQYGTGWINARYTSAGDAAPSIPAEELNEVEVTEADTFGIVNAYALNVRSGPGTNFTSLGVVTGGERLPIIGRTEDSSWYNVQTVVGNGWVSARYLITRNEFGNAPVTTGNVVVNETTVLDTTVIVNTGALNVRSGPGPEYTVLVVVRGGDEFPVLGRDRSYTWLQIETPSGIGWVNWRYIISRSDLSTLPLVNSTAVVSVDPATGETTQSTPTLIGPVAFVATGALNIRSGPNIAFESLGSVLSTTRMPIVGQSADRDWWQVDSPYGLGWVNKNYVLVEGNASNVPVVQ